MINEIDLMYKNDGKIEYDLISDKFVTTLSRWSSIYLKRNDKKMIIDYMEILYWCLCNSEIEFYPSSLRNNYIEVASEKMNLSYECLHKLFVTHEKYFDNYSQNYKVIGIEGIDGTGKTVQSKILEKKLIELGYKVKVIDYPRYNSFFGKEIGNLLSGKFEINANNVDSKSMSLWYALDRKRSIDEIDLSRYDYVIFNRYTLSNAVYQGIRGGLNSNIIDDWVFELEHKELMLPIPNCYIVLDLSVNQSQSNVDKKGIRSYVEEKDLYEGSDDLLRKAREKYKAFSEIYSNVSIINCSIGDKMKSHEQINDEIMETLKNEEIII